MIEPGALVGFDAVGSLGEASSGAIRGALASIRSPCSATICPENATRPRPWSKLNADHSSRSELVHGQPLKQCRRQLGTAFHSRQDGSDVPVAAAVAEHAGRAAPAEAGAAPASARARDFARKFAGSRGHLRAKVAQIPGCR